MTTTNENIKQIGDFSAGVQFSIEHCDGYIAHETVSHITLQITSKLVGRGFNRYNEIGKTYFITCESGASYTLDELRIKVA